MFIDKLDHKPTIHQISTKTPQKGLHRIDLPEDQGELCIEIQRERRSHLANNYGPEGLLNYSHIIGEAMVLMYKPFVIDSPSGRAPEKAPRWNLTGTEGCGGGNRVSWCSSMVSGYVGIYRRKK